ncbi:hypothetical protein H0H93_009059, partial [Arthromyces matolae]
MAAYRERTPLVAYALRLAECLFAAFIVRSSACTVNDIFDRNFDAQVERTKNRPLPSGRLSVKAASIFLLAQYLIGAIFFFATTKGRALQVALFQLVPLFAIYPLMKRVTDWPQAWLGVAMNFDTIYACQDIKDDVKAGVRSSALALGSIIKPMLIIFGLTFLVTFGVAGLLNHQGPVYFVISIGGLAAHLIWQLVTVDLDVPESCWIFWVGDHRGNKHPFNAFSNPFLSPFYELHHLRYSRTGNLGGEMTWKTTFPLFLTCSFQVLPLWAARIVPGSETADFTVSSLVRPKLPVPQLAQTRDILARLQAPIISTLISRTALPIDNEDEGPLFSFIHSIERQSPQRFFYGTLEYPFTLANISPDSGSIDSFPPGTFHQDTFTPNRELFAFYHESLVPAIGPVNAVTGAKSIYFHLVDQTNEADKAAEYTLDSQLLALLSHRVSIGKLVAEAKFAADVPTYTPLINSQDEEALRALVTNKTQEALVLSAAANATTDLAAAWGAAQSLSPTQILNFTQQIQPVVAQLYGKLIDLTTTVE